MIEGQHLMRSPVNPGSNRRHRRVESLSIEVERQPHGGMILHTNSHAWGVDAAAQQQGRRADRPGAQHDSVAEDLVSTSRLDADDSSPVDQEHANVCVRFDREVGRDAERAIGAEEHVERGHAHSIAAHEANFGGISCRSEQRIGHDAVRPRALQTQQSGQVWRNLAGDHAAVDERRTAEPATLRIVHRHLTCTPDCRHLGIHERFVVRTRPDISGSVGSLRWVAPVVRT